MIESNLAPLFEAVDHSDSNDNDDFYGDTRVVQHFCPYPVPEKYRLSAILHKVLLHDGIHALHSHTQADKHVHAHKNVRMHSLARMCGSICPLSPS